ncbi:toprim domain-containing protein [Methylobacterium sp. E-046]|uniref:DUF7146 domain-containing protein n=1 Tax=Methylobacterium sp. E-046 TaxID=2836576 RepID=UPI001FBBA4AF|nr:toprim domain-containing protein [Methylobacterium sp. E-046]MCJ2098962.1 toprim domain-containing protein [Methylobacterium sp. E-046]
MRTPLAERALGRWTGLLPMLGVDSRFLTPKQGPCPMCGGKTRFRYDDKGGRGTWICNSCGAGDGAQLAMRVTGMSFRDIAERLDPIIGEAPPVPAKAERSIEDCRAGLNRLWRSASPVRPDDPVGRYLRQRVGLTNVPDCLRTAARLRYQDDTPSFHPGMLAMVRDADGNAATLHRTFLTHDGRKADVAAPRRLMPGTIPPGSAVRLFEIGSTLGIAEGIETALAAASLFGVPVWAAVNASQLAKWVPPAEASEIIVFGDADAAYVGQAAAYALAHRLARKDRTVTVKLPDRVGMDWNDVLLKQMQVEA